MYARYLQLIDSTQAEQPETQKAHSKLHGDFQPWHRVGTLNPCVFKGQLHYTAVFKVDNQQRPPGAAQGTLHSVTWQPRREGSLGQNGRMYRYGLVPLLST